MEEENQNEITEAGMPVMKLFDDFYIFKDKKILLDSIEVVWIHNNGVLGKPVDYEIKHINSKLILYPLEKHDFYMIKFDRMINGEEFITPYGRTVISNEIVEK